MYFRFQPYVPVAERRRRAMNKVNQLTRKGEEITPVTIEGRKIATSFWGEAWCENLECYSDYASRLPRGRSYVRNGSVVDLKIAGGEVTALVAGSELYRIRITIAPVRAEAWRSICRACAGSVSSLVELLQGRLAKSVMERVCRKGDGLFPAPKDIKLSCSCPDWASMCKHVAATLYGVGARLDERPELLFLLRGVDKSELIAGGPQAALAIPAAGKVLEDGDVAALFGIEMAETAAAPAARPGRRAAGTPAGRKAQGAGRGANTGRAKKAPARVAAKPKAARARPGRSVAKGGSGKGVPGRRRARGSEGVGASIR